jgi:hypothetical protein
LIQAVSKPEGTEQHRMKHCVSDFKTGAIDHSATLPLQSSGAAPF